MLSVARAPRKWERVLEAFLQGRSFHRFHAERELGDHCLHSTVAALESRGVKIDRRNEVVPSRFGPAHVKQYQLARDPENLLRARELLAAASACRSDARSVEAT